MVLTPTRSLPGAAKKVAPGGVAAAALPQSITARIAEMQSLGADILRLLLELPEGADFTYTPGQYLTVDCDDGRTRCFSMAAPPAGNVIELHVQRWPEGRFSQWLAREAKIGDPLSIAGPYGNFRWRSQKSAGVIMLATGTGIAPILAMLTTVFRRDAAHLPIQLYWGMRERSRLYREPLLRHWEATHPNFRFTPVLSAETSDRVQDVALRDAQDLRGVDVYACGAPRMVEEARAKFFACADMSEERFFSDAFAEDAASTAPPLSAPSITITVTGATPRRVEVTIGETLMMALRRAGIGLLAVCGGRASCGTCRVRVAPHCATRLPPPGKVERNLLACLPGRTAEDRLSCQLTLTAEHEGLEICPSG